MYIKNFIGYIEPNYLFKGRLDTFEPITVPSKNWKKWLTHVGPYTCSYCYNQNGKIISVGVDESELVPVHKNCKCEIITLPAIVAGNATRDGKNGADYWLKHYGKLPNYYVSRTDYLHAGWKSGKPPAKWFPNKMMFGEIYNNDKGKLPNAEGRVWCEADINYYEGRRNGHRIFYSNDGLIFVSYDHGCTEFYEII